MTPMLPSTTVTTVTTPSPYDALKAAVRIFSGGPPSGTGMAGHHHFLETGLPENNFDSPFEKLLVLQEVLASIDLYRNSGVTDHDYKEAIRPALLSGPETVQSVIDELSKPEIWQAVQIFAAGLKQQNSIHPNSLNIIALVESNQMIPQLEALKVTTETIKARMTGPKVWAEGETRGIQPRPQGPLKIS